MRHIPTIALWGMGCSDLPEIGVRSRGTDDPTVSAPTSHGPDVEPTHPGDPEPTPACETPASTSAFGFDGVTSQLAVDDPAALGLSTFTIEAWIRRDGYGDTFTSGTGGLRLVPIAGKGRGEDDGSPVDCNYTLGLSGDVLGADFEDLASGGNHPILGTTLIPWGEWHHVAASYDGATLRLYVDGRLDGTAGANATPRYDSVQPFGIGTTFDSARNADGRFHGAIDEVRVWDYARTDAAIAEDRFHTIPAAEGLVGRWALDTEDGGSDSAGGHPGVVVGLPESPGAPLDGGLAPTVALDTLDDGAVVTGGVAELGATVADLDSDRFQVTFHTREVTAADDFAVVVLPDTQYYTDQNRDTLYFFDDQTSWIVENRESLGIVGVLHNGDVTEHAYDTDFENAESALIRLETPFDGLPDGLPYGLVVGNHDESPFNQANATTNYNEWFGVERFQGREYYGGHFGDDNDENWFSFQAGGLTILVVDLQYDESPDPAVGAWARSVLLANPGTFGIVNTHYLLTASGNFATQGQAIYDAVRDVGNLQLMTCGHIGDWKRRTDVYEGHPIHTMLADYQFYNYQNPPGGGGDGYLRLWEFSPALGQLHVSTYSPTLDSWWVDEDNDFTLDVDLRGAGGPFTPLTTVDPVTTSATATFSGLVPGATYEWYATATDCTHTVRTEVRRFTVAP